MESVETGKDKVKKICDSIRKQTLEPAIEEAERLIEEARQKAELLLKQAEEKALKHQQQAEREIEKRRMVFEASMQQGARQAVETLKQQIEEHLLSHNLRKLLTAKLNEPQVAADLIAALLKAVEKEGISGELSAYVASQVPARSVNELLAKQLLESLKEKSVLAGPMRGGVELKLHKEKMTIEMTDEAIEELIGRYIRKDLRLFLFGS